MRYTRCVPAVLAVGLLFIGLSQQRLLAQSERSATFGRDWVRSHPFTIMGLCLTDASPNVGQYMDANMTCMLAWKPHKTPKLMDLVVSGGVPWIGGAEFALASFDESEVKARVQAMTAQYPNNLGWIVNDEPTPDEMQITGQIAEWMRQTYPDKLVFSNVGGDPDYPRHVQTFLSHVRPDVLMFDRYPYSPNLAELDEPDKYFMQVGVIRQAALDTGLPYWAFVQSIDRGGPEFKFAYPYFSESDLRMQVFMYLTYGYSGIGYFMYDYWTTKSAPAFVDQSGAPTHIHHYASKLNREARVLGDVIKHLTSTHIFAVPVSEGVTPIASSEFLPTWERDAIASNPIRSIEIAEPGAGRHGIIGYFRDDDGRQYIMITNMRREHGLAEGSLEATSLTFRVRFLPEVRSLTRLDRETGQPVDVPIANTDEGLSLTLPGGTGDLFKIGSGAFAGM